MIQREEGTIKNIFPRGFGFIWRENQPDLFFHVRAVNCADEAEITPGRPVSFEVAVKDGRARAERVEFL